MTLKFTDKLKNIDLSKAGKILSSVNNSLSAINRTPWKNKLSIVASEYISSAIL